MAVFKNPFKKPTEPTAETGDKSPDGKLDANDPTLSIKKGGLDKKKIKTLFVVFGGFLVLVMIVALMPPGEPPKNPNEVKGGSKDYQIDGKPPSSFNASESDYAAGYEKNATSKAQAPYTMPGKDYPTYTENKPSEQKTVYAVQGGNRNGGTVVADSDAQARQSGMFYSMPGIPGGSSTGGGDGSTSTQQGSLNKQIADLMAGANGESPYDKQNAQEAKRSFLAGRKPSPASNYLDSVATSSMLPDFEIKQGTFIPITIETGINTDLPGELSARVIVDVYDSLTGSNILIPKGSKVFGDYDSGLTFGQNRVLLAWNRILRPDGVTIDLKRMQGADLLGRSGIVDETDPHYGEMFQAVALGTLFDTAIDTTIAFLSSNEFLSSLGSIVKDKKQIATAIAQSLVEKQLNRQPTIIIRPGMRCNIVVNKDIILPGYKIEY